MLHPSDVITKLVFIGRMDPIQVLVALVRVRRFDPLVSPRFSTACDRRAVLSEAYGNARRCLSPDVTQTEDITQVVTHPDFLDGFGVPVRFNGEYLEVSEFERIHGEDSATLAIQHLLETGSYDTTEVRAEIDRREAEERNRALRIFGRRTAIFSRVAGVPASVGAGTLMAMERFSAFESPTLMEILPTISEAGPAAAAVAPFALALGILATGYGYCSQLRS